jgi:PilZ domain-containing protein
MLISDGAENLTEPAVSGTHQPGAAQQPTQRGAPGRMAFDTKLEGRMEKRLPIAIVVHLARVQDEPVGGAELTYTDNVSAHGACVLSNRSWQTGELVQVTSFKEKVPIRGKVTHCEKRGDKRYRIGLNFNGSRVTWPTFRAYSGT